MPKQKQNGSQKKGISTKNNNTGGRQTILFFACKNIKTPPITSILPACQLIKVKSSCIVLLLREWCHRSL